MTYEEQERIVSQHLIDESRKIKDDIFFGKLDVSHNAQEAERISQEEEILESKFNARKAATFCHKQRSR